MNKITINRIILKPLKVITMNINHHNEEATKDFPLLHHLLPMISIGQEETKIVKGMEANKATIEEDHRITNLEKYRKALDKEDTHMKGVIPLNKVYTSKITEIKIIGLITDRTNIETIILSNGRISLIATREVVGVDEVVEGAEEDR